MAAFFRRLFFARKRLRKGGAVFANIHVRNDEDHAAERAAARMAAAFGDVRILDRPGTKQRNAIVMAGAVRGLKKPVLVMPPAIEVGKITRVLDAMQFRATPERPRPAPLGEVLLPDHDSAAAFLLERHEAQRKIELCALDRRPDRRARLAAKILCRESSIADRQTGLHGP